MFIKNIHRLQLTYPKTWKVDAYDRLLGNRAVLDAIRAGKPVKEIEAIYHDDLSAFEQRRRKHLLY